MPKPNRRSFLLGASAALAVASSAESAPGNESTADQNDAFPSHKPLLLDGIHAYTDRLSVPAGETVRFHISSTFPYELQVCRLGTDVDRPERDEVLRAWKVARPERQAIHPGSYIHVARGLAADLKALSLEIWVRLWDLREEQGLIGQFDRTKGAGYGLLVRRDGSLGFYVGDGGAFQKKWLARTEAKTLTRTETSPPAVPTDKREAYGGRGVTLARWHHVVATFDGQTKELWVDGRRVGTWKHQGAFRPGEAPLRIGAFGEDGMTTGCLDGDIAMPVIYSRALAEKEIQARFKAQALRPAQGEHVLGCWPLTEERCDIVADTTGQRPGRIINHATWMIGGPTFNANVDRFGGYDPAKDKNRGHGLRLASDDLYDCRWRPTVEYRLPKNARPGIYAGRFKVREEGEERLYHALFIVKKPVERKAAPILFLASTNTWRAYAGTPFARTWPGMRQSIGHAYHNSPGQPPEFSFYWQHRSGQGSYQMGLKMPWPVAGPYTFQQELAWECSHLCHADRLTLTWLEREGYQHDVASDLDLHQNPRLLDDYRVVFIVGHSEYWSTESMAAVRRYLDRGGNIVALTGNTMFWRVGFSADGSIMECRKVDAPGAQVGPERRGEVWHSYDGRRGGMLRDCGQPAWQTLGLEWMSIHPVGVEGVGPFRVTQADHFLFHKPHEVGLKNGDRFGQPKGRQTPQIIGHEGDVRISTLARFLRQKPPPGAKQPDTDPKGITLLAEGIVDWKRVKVGGPYDYFQRPVPPNEAVSDVAAEMIYWERPEGGRVFYAGSVSAGRGFAGDERFAKLVKNVLHQFGVR